MKHHVSTILSVAFGVFFYIALAYFGLSFWWIFLAFLPLGYIQLYATNRYNFRSTVQLEPIPESGYEKRIAGLDANQNALAGLGFTKIDEFYLRVSPDTVAYSYRHEQYPITLVDYDMQAAKFCDMVTQFDNGYTLTTTNGQNAGVVPLPENRLGQQFPRAGFADLLHAHLDAGQFLHERGFQPSRLQSEIYRQSFLEHFHEAGNYMKSPLSPIKLLYRMATNEKKRYARPIRQQHLANTIRLP